MPVFIPYYVNLYVRNDGSAHRAGGHIVTSREAADITANGPFMPLHWRRIAVAKVKKARNLNDVKDTLAAEGLL